MTTLHANLFHGLLLSAGVYWSRSTTLYDGPAQLALAILAYVTGDDVYAKARHQQFKEDVVAKWANKSWDISAEEVQAWATAHPLPEEERCMWIPARQRTDTL